MGILKSAFTPIVCLPNHLVIQYVNDDKEIDATVNQYKTKKLVQLSLLTAIALSIFIVELQIPNPLPLLGIKLGLANIVTLYVIYRYRAKEDYWC